MRARAITEGPGRRDVLKTVAVAPLLGALGRLAQGPQRPRNLLLIVSDDQSRTSVGAYGNPDCTTPHVDRLAAEGMRFQRGFTQVSICRPSRCSLYTGLEPHAHGATGFQPIAAGAATWPELLNPAAATALIGKLGVSPAERFPFGFLERADKEEDWRSPALYEEAFGRFLASAEDRPFAAVVSTIDPHRPFWHGAPPADAHAVDGIEVPPFLLRSIETREELAKYYDAIRRLDEAVGAVLAVLAEHGRAEDTLVVFTSDNGMPFPFGKTTLYEPGINVPFLARWPGVVEPGTESDAMVCLTDLLPTALDVFGVPAPDEAAGGLPGGSLLPLLRGEVDGLRDEVFLEHDEHRAGHAYPMRGLREGRYKYIRNLRPELTFENSITGFTDATGGEEVARPSPTWESWVRKAPARERIAKRVHAFQHRPPEELYDLTEDPFELTNLAADPEAAPELERMRAALRARLGREEDPALELWKD